MEDLIKPKEYPEICNICGGKVILTSNAVIYGKPYGNGKMYYCTQCGAYVGVHPNNKALGILTNSQIKPKKMACHKVFDEIRTKLNLSVNSMYTELAKRLDISKNLCHFGYFNEAQLNYAYNIMLYWKDNIDKGELYENS